MLRRLRHRRAVARAPSGGHGGAEPGYDSLIPAFDELTGVPIVLNTSFNENEPIVTTPQEAIETLLKTTMDALVLGN